jgi:hypothetical protein
MVQHVPHHFKVMGSSPDAASGKMGKTVYVGKFTNNSSDLRYLINV